MALRAGTVFHGTLGQPTAQVIDGSLKFENDSSTYLSRTPSSAGNRKTWTVSFWVKICKTSGYIYLMNCENTNRFYLLYQSGYITLFNTSGVKLSPDRIFRDHSAWYHMVIAFDTTQSTSTDRLKWYINGEEVSDYRTNNTTYPSQNDQTEWNTATAHEIGSRNGGSFGGIDYYLTDFYFIDGQALDESYFGFTDPLTNTWSPKKYTGTFGTNGFFLPMDNQDNFEKDKSGNGYDWTKNNFSGTSIDPDVVKDSPSGAVFGGRGQTGITTTSSAPSNYCTWNPLTLYAGANYTLSEGNLKAVKSGGDVVSLNGTIGVSFGDGGKFYYEADHNSSPTQGQGIGWGNDQYFTYAYGTGFRRRLFYKNTTVTYSEHDVSGTNIATGLTSNFGKTLGVAFDLDENTMSFYVDGVLQATATGVWGTYFDTTDTLFPFLLGDGTGNNGTIETNFGQKPFKYAPPQGYLPLNSASVRPNKVIPRPDQYVGVTTYNGESSSFRLRTGFSPDLAFIKSRTNTTTTVVFDTVRGLANYFQLSETDQSYSGGITQTFNDGFLVPPPGGAANNASHSYVTWTWKAGGNKNTFNIDDVGYATAAAAGLGASGNSWDSDPTGASVGTKQGFSIIKHTGTGSTGTLPHGLTQKPTFYISKPVSTSGNWVVYTDVIDGSLDYFYLNTTDAKGDSGQSLPTSELFSYGYTANEYIHYLWHDVPGLQKFGTYVGNGNADGPFVELGFRPAVVLRKSTGGGSGYDWVIIDSVRNPDNIANNKLYPQSTGAENVNSDNSDSGDNSAIDILSNGFKVRANNGRVNASGTTFIYAAWAEAPASNLFGGQSNAR